MDNIGKHSDDEKGLSNIGVVAISYGAVRKFRIRDKKTNKIIKDIPTIPYEIFHMKYFIWLEIFKKNLRMKYLLKKK